MLNCLACNGKPQDRVIDILAAPVEGTQSILIITLLPEQMILAASCELE